MKNRAVLLLIGLMISCSFVSGQESRDTLRKDSVYPRFYDSFSAEESWQIHKEAYKKQLEAKGLSGDEISKKMDEYDKRKAEFIDRMIEQRKLAEEQRQLAEVQRQKAAEQRKEAEVQRQKAYEVRKEAEAQRKKAEEERRIAQERRNCIHHLLSENFTITAKESEPKVVKINVTEISTLFFNLNGEISSGTVMIEIFNPRGKKEGELSLERLYKSSPRTESGSSGTSSGSLSKTINSPETGEWSVKITPEKSDCHVNISVAQYEKPTVDE
jgi:hypothetical protein